MIKQVDPILALVYAESGMGKTADTIYAFPNALFIAAPGALNSAVGLVGLAKNPVRVDAADLDEAIAVCQEYASKKDAPIAVVVDDLSLLVQRTVMRMEQKGQKGFDLWRLVLNKVLQLADAARYSLKSHFIMSAHIQTPHDVRGEFIKGGPMLPGKGAAVLPKHCDLALRAVSQPERLIWPVVYQCNNSDDSYTTKDRNNVCADQAPMNLGEIMRASGYNVPRIFDWQEAVVEKLSHALAGKSNDEIKVILAAAQKQIETKYTKNHLHIGWTFRDAIDRTTIRATLNSPLKRLFAGSSSNASL